MKFTIYIGCILNIFKKVETTKVLLVKSNIFNRHAGRHVSTILN